METTAVSLLLGQKCPQDVIDQGGSLADYEDDDDDDEDEGDAVVLLLSCTLAVPYLCPLSTELAKGPDELGVDPEETYQGCCQHEDGVHDVVVDYRVSLE